MVSIKSLKIINHYFIVYVNTISSNRKGGFTKEERFSLFYEPFNNNFPQKSWDEARTSCVCTESESEAADLVDVQSEAEDGFLKALAGVDKETWLGNK